MKQFLTSLLILSTLFTKAQVTLEPTDKNNLIAIAKLYSQNPNARGEAFINSINGLRTPKLNQIADALIAVGKGDKILLENRFLSRPTDEELFLWYVIREIHYNKPSETHTPRPDTVVANEILSKKIDSRWLLDNYYYRIHGGLASLFNDADLSKYNFKLDELGFQNETEKSIFFLNMMDALVGGRFRVLERMQNNKKILEFSGKLPKVNGKEYFYHKSFDYPDFDWIGFDKTESYNSRHIGSLYNTLAIQFAAATDIKGKKEGQRLYMNSILHEPKYFEYSPFKEDLIKLYEKSK